MRERGQDRQVVRIRGNATTHTCLPHPLHLKDYPSYEAYMQQINSYFSISSVAPVPTSSVSLYCPTYIFLISSISPCSLTHFVFISLSVYFIFFPFTCIFLQFHFPILPFCLSCKANTFRYKIHIYIFVSSPHLVLVKI